MRRSGKSLRLALAKAEGVDGLLHDAQSPGRAKVSEAKVREVT